MTDNNQVDLPFDAWETEDPRSYSIDKIYTEAIDKKHNTGETTRCKVRSDHLEQVAMIVAKNWVPDYHTSQDFIRDAIYHRMHYWSQLISDGELRRVVNNEGRRLAFERFQRQVSEAFAMCEAAETSLAMALRAGDLTVLESALTEISEELNEAREPYASKLRKLYSEYGKKYQELVETQRLAHGDG